MDDRLLGVHHERLAWRVLDREAVVVDLASGVTLFLNESATVVWEQMALGACVHELSSRLCERFDIDEQRATAEVHGLIAQLDALEAVIWDVLGPRAPARETLGDRTVFVVPTVVREEAFIHATGCGKSNPTDLGCELLARDS
jgi:hypothetical protein